MCHPALHLHFCYLYKTLNVQQRENPKRWPVHPERFIYNTETTARILYCTTQTLHCRAAGPAARLPPLPPAPPPSRGPAHRPQTPDPRGTGSGSASSQGRERAENGGTTPAASPRPRQAAATPAPHLPPAAAVPPPTPSLPAERDTQRTRRAQAPPSDGATHSTGCRAALHHGKRSAVAAVCGCHLVRGAAEGDCRARRSAVWFKWSYGAFGKNKLSKQTNTSTYFNRK